MGLWSDIERRPLITELDGPTEEQARPFDGVSRSLRDIMAKRDADRERLAEQARARLTPSAEVYNALPAQVQPAAAGNVVAAEPGSAEFNAVVNQSMEANDVGAIAGLKEDAMAANLMAEGNKQRLDASPY